MERVCFRHILLRQNRQRKGKRLQFLPFLQFIAIKVIGTLVSALATLLHPCRRVRLVGYVESMEEDIIQNLTENPEGVT
jgi:hypothetical protein